LINVMFYNFNLEVDVELKCNVNFIMQLKLPATFFA
jgi:hypothetical protein